MNSRILLLSAGYLCLGLLVGWLSFSLGRGKSPDKSKTTKSTQATSTPRGPDSSSSLGPSLAVVIKPTFSLREKQKFAGIKESFIDAIAKSDAILDPRLLALATELTADEVEAAAEAVLASQGAGRDKLLQVILARWAAFEPEAAAEFAATKTGGFLGGLALDRVFESWGRRDPRAALAWIENAKSSGRFTKSFSLDRTLRHLFHTWAQTDPKGAGRAAHKISANKGSLSPWVGIGALAALEEHREAAITAANSATEETERIRALGWVLGGWAKSDPHSAAAWLDKNNYLDSDTEWAVSQRFSRRDPVAAAEWLLERAAPEHRERAFSRALNVWARSDIPAAAKWLEEFGPTDGSIGIIAQSYATVDLDKAIEWAKRTSEAVRDDTIAEALAEAQMRHGKDKIKGYYDSGSLPAEEMKTKVEKAFQLRARRF